MIKLNGKTLLLGGFHDHWSRCGQNSALLLAALNYYHYDFVTLMCGPDLDAPHRELATRLSDRIRIYPGREQMFGWGHVVTVNPRGPVLGVDGGDYEASLRLLKESCDLVILAHPEYPGTWEKLFLTGEMDRLLDAGAMHAVNLINTRGFEGPRLRELIAWFDERDARGLVTPIVGGWDAHMVLPQRDLPIALYENERSPRGHIDTGGYNRTILFCEENSLPAIVDAVRRGQTVIEDLQTGELAGPRALVQFLKESDYAGATARLDQARGEVRLTIPSPWVSNGESVLSISRPGRVHVVVPTMDGLKPASFPGRQTLTDGIAGVEAGESVQVAWPHPPAGRNSDYAAVAFRTPDGFEKIWAVETRHPIQMELLPAYREGKPGVELRSLRAFSGKVSIKVEGLLEWSGEMEVSVWVPLPKPPQALICRASWRAELPNGFWRAEETLLTFITAQKFNGDWEALTVYAVDEACFAPTRAYGASRPYPGKEVFAVYLQFGWDAGGLHLRAKVRDNIHYQPNRGHYAYNADCLQLGIDPALRRKPSIGHVYSFNLALTPEGPELYRWLAPTEEDSPGFHCPQDDVSLGENFLRIEPVEGGLIYDLNLPWSELAPFEPNEGARFGIYFIAMNNNGVGLVDTLHWPLHFEGMWLVPGRWGVVSLV